MYMYVLGKGLYWAVNADESMIEFWLCALGLWVLTQRRESTANNTHMYLNARLPHQMQYSYNALQWCTHNYVYTQQFSNKTLELKVKYDIQLIFMIYID